MTIIPYKYKCITLSTEVNIQQVQLDYNLLPKMYLAHFYFNEIWKCNGHNRVLPFINRGWSYLS